MVRLHWTLRDLSLCRRSPRKLDALGPLVDWRTLPRLIDVISACLVTWLISLIKGTSATVPTSCAGRTSTVFREV